MNKSKIIVALLILLLPISLPAQQAATLRANFDPSAGLVPFPINLLFSGSTDGTLNIPIADPNDPASGPTQALNALDGFSTVNPIVATFSNGVLPIPGNPTPIDSAIDPASVSAGTTVRLFEVELVNPFLAPTDRPFAVERVKRELIADEDYVAGLSPDPAGKTVVITPLKPLKAKTGYMVVLTNGIRAALDGSPAFPDRTYIFARYRGNHHRPLVDENGSSNFPQLTDAQARALVPIQTAVLSQEDAAAGQGIDRGSIILSWTFLTQSIDDALQVVRSGIIAQPLGLDATGSDTSALGLAGLADIYAGTFQIPYYLQAPAAPQDAPIILSTRWQGVNDSAVTRYNPKPIAPQSVTIPVLATVPNANSGQSKPPGGWPVVIFQHGITQNRTNVFAVADTLASVGFAAIAIDLPLHGITDTENPFYAGPLERTFNVDLINNETGAPGPDGMIDASGIHYINLTSSLTTRDNIRQGSADLFHLTATLPMLDIDGDALADFATPIRFVGHSLGAIVGVSFLAIENEISAATLANPGGGLTRLLLGSESFGPRILAGLMAAGLEPGTANFEAFVNAFQQTVDSGDPINYAGAAAEAHPIHMIEVVGPPPDATIPNSVPGAPLTGTEPLARIMGLASVAATTVDDMGLRAIVRFTEGAHSSFLLPTTSAAATVEMQSEMAGFMVSNGTVLNVANPDVLQPIQ